MKLRIAVNEKTYEVEYDSADSSSPPPLSLSFVQSLVLPTPPPAGSSATSDVEEKVYRSPVAGIVTRIYVEPGQSLEAGDIILVVEAMKMENNLTAAAPVKMKLLKVKSGDTVKAGEIVAELE